ncbi:hypothetical protein ABT121_26780 [Streptomyces sp. NPDC001928]|uniref:hypothetical protein n=1 Tax=Streptomyces sp. NPDC001928 TaxID=3154404 RepID=UPI00331C7A26
MPTEPLSYVVPESVSHVAGVRPGGAVLAPERQEPRRGGRALSRQAPRVRREVLFWPYLPGMALFGIPHALFGGTAFADARVWFCAVFLVSMLVAGRRSGRNSPGPGGGSGGRAVVLLAAFPAVALPLVVDGGGAAGGRAGRSRRRTGGRVGRGAGGPCRSARLRRARGALPAR